MKKLILILLTGLSVGSSAFAVESQAAPKKKNEGITWKRVAKWSGLSLVPLIISTRFTQVNMQTLAGNFINSLNLQLTRGEKFQVIRELCNKGKSRELAADCPIDPDFLKARRNYLISANVLAGAAVVCIAALLYGGAKKLLSKKEKPAEEQKQQPVTA